MPCSVQGGSTPGGGALVGAWQTAVTSDRGYEKQKHMITLGIETSCDETAAALVEDGSVLSSVVSSSVHLHSEYGGIVPEIASRFHTEYIFSVLTKTFESADRDMNDVDLVAVTKGPGLPGSLLVGVAFAKAIGFTRGIPVIGVDHLKAHVISAFLEGKRLDRIRDLFPFVGMVISGGHTRIYDCRGLRDFRLIGRTLDDAVGEAYDKVARILGLGYPGGPVIERRAASHGGGDKPGFPRALLKNSPGIDFSFSGLKTAVMYYWRDAVKTEQEKDRICYSFQEAVIDVIDKKISMALRATGAERLAAGGGVINNRALRQRISERCAREGVDLCLPPGEYCTDNAAMTAASGEALFNAGERSDLYLTAEPSGARHEHGGKTA